MSVEKELKEAVDAIENISNYTSKEWRVLYPSFTHDIEKHKSCNIDEKMHMELTIRIAKYLLKHER